MTSNVTDLGVNFFEEYFIKPIIDKSGYNVVNTIAYGILLVIGSYLLFKLFTKFKVKIDFKFLLAHFPFLIFVGVWRSLTDAGVYPYHFLTTTPGLYVPVLSLYVTIFFLSVLLDKRKKLKFNKVMMWTGLILLASQLVFVKVALPDALGLFLLFGALTITPFVVLRRYVKALRNDFNLWIFISHMLDVTATHVTISYYNYFEQHVIPNLFINLFGSTWGFFVLKLIVLIPVIYYLDKSRNKENAELVDFVKVMFIVYGLTIGVRGFSRMIMGV